MKYVDIVVTLCYHGVKFDKGGKRLEVNCYPFREVYYNSSNDFRVVACSVIGPPKELELNEYGNITLSGTNLIHLALKEYIRLEIEPNLEYGKKGSYKLKWFGGFKATDNQEITVDPDQELPILLQYMTSSQANYCHEAYPNFVYLIANGRSDQIDVKKIYNVGKKRLTSYIQKINDSTASIKFLMAGSPYGITDIKDAEKLSKHYSSPEIFLDRIKVEPYNIFVNILEKDFPSADKKILEIFPFLIDSEDRCEACACYILADNEQEGNTRLDANVLAQAVKILAPESVHNIRKVAEHSEHLHYEDSNKKIALSSTFSQEKNIAKNICSRLEKPNTVFNWEQYTTVDGFSLTKEQVNILQIMNNSRVCVLSGYAGTGKTASTKAIVKMLKDYGKSFYLLAPTGIASKQLANATGCKASTINMFIIENTFTTADYIIIDEASMVSVELLSSLFDCLAPSCNIIFICDEAQLPSVSCGNIVYDIITSNKVPVAKLTKVFRYNSSGITTYATDSRNGVVEHIGQNYDDVDFYNIGDINDLLPQIGEIYQQYLDKGYSKQDILILSPMNKYGAGSVAINNYIQENFNDNSDALELETGKKSSLLYKLGDRVLNTKNNYKANKLEIDEDGEEYIITSKVFNGDIGYIRNIISPSDGLVEYNYSSSPSSHEIDGIVEVNPPALIIEYDHGLYLTTKEELPKIKLGYAESIHKSQGSQSKVVIIVIDSSHAHMINRNILYVAFTRCQEHLTIIGNVETITNGLDKIAHLERDTWLKDLLEKGGDTDEILDL